MRYSYGFIQGQPDPQRKTLKTQAHLLLFLGVVVRNERRTQLGAALTRNDRIMVVRLGNEEGRAVSLPSAFDRARAKRIEVNAASPVDPTKGTHVAHKNFELRQLSRHPELSTRTRM